MAITLATAIVYPSTTGYDLAQIMVDFTSPVRTVTISYTPIGGGTGGQVTMTMAQFDAAPGTTLRLRALNALAGPNGLNLTGATVT